MYQIIPEHAYFLFSILSLVVLDLVDIAIHVILVEMSHNSVLLINNLSKRGDVETLMRSSVFPSSQVKMKPNLTASR